MTKEVKISEVASSPGMNAGSHQSLEETRSRFSLRASEGAHPCSYGSNWALSKFIRSSLHSQYQNIAIFRNKAG